MATRSKKNESHGGNQPAVLEPNTNRKFKNVQSQQAKSTEMQGLPVHTGKAEAIQIDNQDINEVLKKVNENNALLQQLVQHIRSSKTKPEKETRSRHDNETEKDIKIKLLEGKIAMLQAELSSVHEKLKLKEKQLERIAKENLEYLEKTGNAVLADNDKSSKAIRDIKNLREEFLNFSDSLEGDIIKSTGMLHELYPFINYPEDAIEIILAEGLHEAFKAGVQKIIVLLNKTFNANLEEYHQQKISQNSPVYTFIQALNQESEAISLQEKAAKFFDLLYTVRKEEPQNLFTKCQLYFISVIESNQSFKEYTIQDLTQIFMQHVKKRLHGCGIKCNEDDKHFATTSNNAAKVIWALSTLPDPILLYLNTKDNLTTKKQHYDSSRFEIHGNNKTAFNKDSKEFYEIDAYAYPMVFNSYKGKMIEKAMVFVHKI